MINLNFLTHYNINGEKQEIITSKHQHHFNIKTVFTAYRELQRCFRVGYITWHRTEEEKKKKSRTPEAQWEVGPWGSQGPDKLWLVWALRYLSGDLKRSCDSLPCQAFVVVVENEHSENVRPTGRLVSCSPCRSLYPKISLGYLELCVHSFILSVITFVKNWNYIHS